MGKGAPVWLATRQGYQAIPLEYYFIMLNGVPVEAGSCKRSPTIRGAGTGPVEQQP
jgi:hypothetical protein